MHKAGITVSLAVMTTAVCCVCCSCGKTVRKETLEQESSKVVETVYDTNDVKVGEVAADEKEPIQDAKLEGLKLDLSGMADHSSGKSDSNESSKSMQGGLDWSNSVLSDDSLVSAREIAVELYQNKLNKDGNRYVVEMDRLWDGDLSHFDTPVFYYVSKAGILYLQMRMNVYDLTEKMSDSRYVALGLRYNEEGNIVLADEEG